MAISFLVIVHELSHLLVAKWLGLNVEEFSVGFGPTILSAKFWGTKWTLRLVLFGGFVKVEGLDFSSSTSVPLWKRFLTVLAGPVGNWIFAFLLLVFTFSFFGETYKLYYVAQVLRDSARDAGLKEGDAIYAVQGEMVVSIADLRRKLNNCSQPCPLGVMSDGGKVTVRVKLGEVGKRKVVGVSLYETELFEPFVAKAMMPNLAVYEGLRVVKVGSHSVEGMLDFSYFLFKSFLKGSVTLTFENGRSEKFEGKIPLIFVERRSKISVLRSFVRAWEASVGFLQTVGFFFSHLKETYTQISGPVGIVAVSVTVAKAGWDKFLFLLALISFNLAVFNLLPLPALDGGRLVFLLARAVGVKFSERREMVFHLVGFFLLLTLLVVVTMADLLKLR